ncbi:uncharacterized protein LACBIDRAFT_298856 [Laccaria bicolor S238N-H82]|uniref:Predicted protein n=1 Tax=Laccaria bicolor (strain S238N-H82 / ATCC MYA-4686) TaxID=486041 RepID=B0DE64_LACBS|nr:uncharacterized protein LACBIDRAFT_298856 [Laccaria bicolor S238N-H82]EDR07085.1 predicted protein [Laccaria bicolor S238N-H82]|eukprot:XP_001882016.1 predicted protein [Laccaria bicolor S238N-H82]
MQDLQAAFCTFHIPPGQLGPPLPMPHTNARPRRNSYSANVNASLPTPSRPSRSPRHPAYECLRECMSFWEQRIVWGDHDAFQWVLSLLSLMNGC